ncbi:MAG: hypothetical protein HQK83_14040 [Fibrobacteria bacterium]|nr:hypothetical protein [Fibrobacteria bacterium]
MKTIFLIPTLILVITGCLFNEVRDNKNSNTVLLSQTKEMERMHDTLSVYTEDSSSAKRTAATVTTAKKIPVTDFTYTITQVARVLPVNIAGTLVQANDIVIQGSQAVVAYNFAGDIFAGAIQVIDISKKGEPEIILELLFNSIDINAVATDGNEVIFGGAADPDKWPAKAFVGKFNIKNPDPDNIENSFVFLPSHAVTGITRSGNNYFAASGAKDGALVSLDKNLLPLDTVLIDDIRDVKSFSGGVCIITGITDSKETTSYVRTLTTSLDASGQWDILNFGSDYHKATLEINGGQTALLGLSEAGTRIISLPDGDELYQNPNPVITSSLKANTNSVSSDANLLFTANGNYGFRVYKISSSDFSMTEYVGYYPFEGLTEGGENYSANHVEYQANHLFVAAGVGGVIICVIEEK